MNKKDLEEAFKIVGPLAAIQGIKEADTKLIIDYVDKLAKAGINGNQAGHALRVLLNQKFKGEIVTIPDGSIKIPDDAMQRILDENPGYKIITKELLTHQEKFLKDNPDLSKCKFEYEDKITPVGFGDIEKLNLLAGNWKKGGKSRRRIFFDNIIDPQFFNRKCSLLSFYVGVDETKADPKKYKGLDSILPDPDESDV